MVSYLAKERNGDQKAEKNLFDSVVDVAAKTLENNFEEFKKEPQEYKFFCFGHVDSSVESQTIINNLVLKMWKEEKPVPRREPKYKLLTHIFFSTVLIASGLWLAKYI